MASPTPPPVATDGAAPAADREDAPLLEPFAHEAQGGHSSETAGAGDRSPPKAFGIQWTQLGLLRIAAALLLVTVVLMTAFWPRGSKAPAGLCLTPACINAASEYLKNLSPDYKNIDPCDDFEEYVCGGWRNIHDMRADQGTTGTLELMGDDATTAVRHILEGNYPGASAHSGFSPRNLHTRASSTDEQNFEELKKAYNTCMDTDTIVKRGAEPIVKLLDELAAVLSKSSSDDYSKVLLFFENLGLSSFFQFYAGDDDKNPEVQIVRLDPRTSFGLPNKEYLKDKEVVSQYLDTVTKVLGAVKPSVAKLGGGAGVSAADAAKAVVELESRLLAAAPDKVDEDNMALRYNLISVADVSKLLPQFGFEKVLKKLVPSDYTLDMTITAFPDVLANVSQIVADTPKETVDTFLYWQLIRSLGDVVLGPETQPLRQFKNTLQGKDPNAEPERWRTCVSHAGNTVGWILSRFYVEKAFSAAAKDFGNQIISDIRAAYIKRFDSLSWMDDEVKAVATDKVHNIDQKVGYPDSSPNIMDPEDLRKYYSELNVTSSYFDNALSANSFETKQMWSKLGKPTDMKEWGMIPSTVNAYYNPPHNEIVFPAAIMQFPLFDVELPNYVSYGAFGAVAGHELSHAFDNNGRHYDVHGRLADWWTNHTVEAFTDKAQCISDEFSNFTVVGKDGPIHIKGAQTLGENIADSGGLATAFRAWQARRVAQAGGKEAELLLPGLDQFTHEQLFFLSFGNVWCSKWRPAMLTNRVMTDEHAPNPVRIKGSVLNSRAFREAFQCPVKEPTCELW